jgi:hypothetical protein
VPDLLEIIKEFYRKNSAIQHGADAGFYPPAPSLAYQ